MARNSSTEFDDRAQPVAISLGKRQPGQAVCSHQLEGFSSAVIGGDGRIVWAVTSANRLLRTDLFTGLTDEILARWLCYAWRGWLRRARLGNSDPRDRFTKGQVALDGDVQLPLVDAAPEGLWVQIPWEYASSSRGVHKVLIRSQNNSFEAVANVGVTPE